eukprot:5297953-Karenia_brevis.AAC.1
MIGWICCLDEFVKSPFKNSQPIGIVMAIAAKTPFHAIHMFLRRNEPVGASAVKNHCRLVDASIVHEQHASIPAPPALLFPVVV